MAQDTQNIKFRLIGAAVVVVSLTLAWWLLLDHDVKRYQETRVAVPARIDIERFDVEQPQSVRGQEQLEQERQAMAAKKEPKKPTQVQTVEPKKPAVKPIEQAKPVVKQTKPAAKTAHVKPAAEKMIEHDEQTGLPIAYVVQVGSFGKQDNAEQLKKRLLDKNLPAYVKRFNLAQGAVYRVLIGPKLSKSRAEEILPFIKLELNLDGQVLRYKPGFEE